jgi:hypothetical protein
MSEEMPDEVLKAEVPKENLNTEEAKTPVNEIIVGEVLTADELEEKVDVDKPFTYYLSIPVTVAGKRFTELSVDFNKLKARDMEKLAAMKGSNSGDANMNEFSKSYLMQVVSTAAGININEFREFSMKDATALTMAAQIFLMSAVSKLPKKK